MEVPATAFGPGSRQRFSHDFEGESAVHVQSIDDIAAWLSRREYVSDVEQFHEPDLWQQPCEFERRQRGDCEDFALWTWRKLIEIGVEAEFFVGRVAAAEGRSSNVSMRGLSIAPGAAIFFSSRRRATGNS